MEKRARDVIAGALRPNDPRRFLVEAMIGAMNADQKIDPREQEMIQRRMAEHAMFAGLSPQNARLLLELATDAVNFAGSANARISAIAKGLPARLHRFTAMAMETYLNMSAMGANNQSMEDLYSMLGNAGNAASRVA